MSYKQLAKKILKMWIDHPDRIALADFVDDYCRSSKIKDPKKLKEFVLFLCDPHTIKQIETKFGIKENAGIPPVCCRCGTMSPENTVKTDLGATVYWVRPADTGNIIHIEKEEITMEPTAHFVAILDKEFVWDGSYNIVCVDCAVELYDEIDPENTDNLTE